MKICTWCMIRYTNLNIVKPDIASEYIIALLSLNRRVPTLKYLRLMQWILSSSNSPEIIFVWGKWFFALNHHRIIQPLDDFLLDFPHIHCQYLWEFLHQILLEKQNKYIAWKNQTKGVFHLLDHNGLARLWGKQKNRKNMTYEKLSRALRYYYSKNILKKVPGQRLTYKFVRNLNGKKYPNWARSQYLNQSYLKRSLLIDLMLQISARGDELCLLFSEQTMVSW